MENYPRGFKPIRNGDVFCLKNISIIKHFYWLLGLDPASLHFITDRTDLRLDESDALYVDVIHSNAGVLGTTIASGHTDFWPNGGILQPGCQEPGKQLKSRDNYHIFTRNISYPPIGKVF